VPNVFDPVFGCDLLFVAEVLPFGATAAVYSFNKAARAWRVIGTRLLSLIWSNYYDDFPQLDVDALSEATLKNG
jgi:hypothetical protein